MSGFDVRNGDVDAKARGSRGSPLNSPLIPRPASGILRCFLNLFMNGKGLCRFGPRAYFLGTPAKG